MLTTKQIVNLYYLASDLSLPSAERKKHREELERELARILKENGYSSLEDYRDDFPEVTETTITEIAYTLYLIDDCMM